MSDYVSLAVVYPHPPDQVWRALTDSEALARWLLPNDFSPRLGHRFTFRAPPRGNWDGVVTCEVLRLDPPHVIAFSWSGDPDLPPTVVRFILEPVAGGTRLRLEHAADVGLSVGYVLDECWRTGLAEHFRLQVDEVALTDALFAYLVDPEARRPDQPAVRWLRSVAPEVVPVLESMLLDGEVGRPDIAHFVRALADGDLVRQLRAARLHRATHGDTAWPSVLDLPRLFRLQVDTAAILPEAFTFVTTPDASRNGQAIVAELDDLAPDVLPALESMILDGVTDQTIVADYLRGALGPDPE